MEQSSGETTTIKVEHVEPSSSAPISLKAGQGADCTLRMEQFQLEGVQFPHGLKIEQLAGIPVYCEIPLDWSAVATAREGAKTNEKSTSEPRQQDAETHLHVKEAPRIIWASEISHPISQPGNAEVIEPTSSAIEPAVPENMEATVQPESATEDRSVVTMEDVDPKEDEPKKPIKKRKPKRKPKKIRPLPEDLILGDDREPTEEETKEARRKSHLKKGKPMVAQARELANNVCEYMRREAKKGKFILPPSNWLKRSALATGVSVNCLLRIRKEKAVTGTFTTPGLTRARRSTITNLPADELHLIKEEMKRLMSDGMTLTVNHMLGFARDRTSFKGSRTSLWRIMKSVTKRKKTCPKKKEEGWESPPKEKKSKGKPPRPSQPQEVMIEQNMMTVPQTYTVRTDNSMPLASAEALLMLTQQAMPSSTAATTTIYQQPHTYVSQSDTSRTGMVNLQPSNSQHMNLVSMGQQDPITIQLELPSLVSAGIVPQSQGQPTSTVYTATPYTHMRNS